MILSLTELQRDLLLGLIILEQGEVNELTDDGYIKFLSSIKQKLER